MKKILFNSLLFLLILGGFSGYFFLYEARYMSSRASTGNITLSVENSYIFFTPLMAKSDGQEKIRVTVFALNNQGLGVEGKQVVIGNPSVSGLQIQTIQGATDSRGMAIFDVSSSKPLDIYLEVKVDGVTLGQKAHLTFN